MYPSSSPTLPSIRPVTLTVADPSTAAMDGMNLRVAYQGVPGAFSEAAASKAYPHSLPIPCPQFEDAFQEVELRTADRAVLPFENSFAGPIHENYDRLLLHHLHIVGEVHLPVHHCLVSLPDVGKQNLKRVISHWQALAQCQNTLTKLGLNEIREAAAEYIAKNNLRDTAAIASARAAAIYGLQILEDGIQDDPHNLTRFLILARDPIVQRMDRPLRTSIVFAGEKRSGVASKVRSALAFCNIKAREVVEPRPYHLSLVEDDAC